MCHHVLAKDTLLTLLRALIVSKVDCYSTVLAGVSLSLTDRLQSVLNTAARLVFSARRSEHVAPLLRDLHWLKVPERIKFCLCVLTHWCLHGTVPPYLAETLQRTSDMSACRHLRSAVTPTLVIPSTRRSTLGDRSFPDRYMHGLELSAVLTASSPVQAPPESRTVRVLFTQA